MNLDRLYTWLPLGLVLVMAPWLTYQKRHSKPDPVRVHIENLEHELGLLKGDKVRLLGEAERLAKLVAVKTAVEPGKPEPYWQTSAANAGVSMMRTLSQARTQSLLGGEWRMTNLVNYRMTNMPVGAKEWLIQPGQGIAMVTNAGRIIDYVTPYNAFVPSSSAILMEYFRDQWK